MSTSRKKFLTGALGVLGAFEVMTRPTEAADFVYKYANNVPADFPRTVRALQMADQILHETNGRLQIQVFPNGILGTDSGMLSQLRSGAIQFYTIDGGLLQSIVPVAGIQGVGFAFKDNAAAFRAFDGDLGAYVRGEIAAKGLYAFERMWSNGMRQITSSTHPIKSVDDMTGFKIRTPAGALWVDLFKSLGAQVATMSADEMYTALQTHIVDGQENSYAGIETFKVYEVQKYLSVTNHMWSAPWFLANVDALHALPPDIQAVVSRNVNKYALLDRADNERANATLAATLRSQGMIFNDCDQQSFRKKLLDAGFYAKWQGVFGSDAWTLLERYSGKLG